MIYDQHCHSMFSKDSGEFLTNYFKICNEYHIKYLVTTEHIEFNSACDNTDWTVDYDQLNKELETNHKIFPNVIPLLGIEIGYRKEYINNMLEVINSQKFDVVNMSIHDNGICDYYMKEPFKQIGIDKMLNIYFDNILDGLNNFNNFDVLSHFDYGFKTAKLIDNSLSINKYEMKVREIFKKVISLNKALEINIKVQSTINDLNHLKTILKWYVEEGGKKLTLSSDAHTKEAYKKYFEVQNQYIEIIKEFGFKYLCYFIERKELHYDII